jgi:hypothetical protein
MYLSGGAVFLILIVTGSNVFITTPFGVSPMVTKMSGSGSV